MMKFAWLSFEHSTSDNIWRLFDQSLTELRMTDFKQKRKSDFFVDAALFVDAISSAKYTNGAKYDVTTVVCS